MEFQQPRSRAFGRATLLSFPSRRADGPGPAHFSTPILPTRKESQFSLDFTDRGEAGVPALFIRMTASRIGRKAMPGTRLRGKYLIPHRSLRKAPIVLLARDPRDAFVSYFVQLTRRNPATPGEHQELPIGDLLRHPRFGIAAMVEVMNGWLAEFGDRSDFSIVRYERTARRPARAFHELLAPSAKSKSTMRCLVRRSIFRFRNMQKLEAAGDFGSKNSCNRAIARTRKPSKSARGKWVVSANIFPPQDQSYAAQVCAALNPRFRLRDLRAQLGLKTARSAARGMRKDPKKL